MTDRHRLFVAVAVPAWVREDLEAAVAPLRDDAAELRWVDASSWHLTIAFLGDVPSSDVPAVAGALAGAVADGPNPTIELAGTADTFDDRVLWAAIVDDGGLTALAGSVRARLEPLGFAEERPFHPHLTLARPPRGKRVPADVAKAYDGPTTSWRADQLNLMRSQPGDRGPRYETMATWPLA